MKPWTLAVALLALAGSSAASASPDFSGVWRWYLEPGQQMPRPSTPAADSLPLKPEARAKIAAYKALVSPKGETPGGACLGTGMPGNMMSSGGYPMEIMQRPDQINIIYEAWNEVRRVYFGRKVIAVGDRLPDRNGYSIGRWAGDHLIVVTDSLKAAVDQAYPHSANAKLTEEYHLSKDGKTLFATLTIEDPDWYSRTFTAEKKWSRDPEGRVMPYECNEPMWEAHVADLAKAAGVASPLE